MADPLGDSVPLTGDPRIDAVTQGGSWGFDGGPQVLTYSFNTIPGGAAWTPAAQNAVTQALAAWSAVANVTFSQVGSGDDISQSAADIAFGLSSGELLNNAGAIGVSGFVDPEDADPYRDYINAVFGTSYNSANYANPAGDIFIETDYPGFAYLQPGGDGLLTILHEIGHALGLKHPFDDGGNGRPTANQLGVPQYDDGLWTVMSYDYVSPYYHTGNQATPMLLDVLAVQQIYGANMSYHAGNDTYVLKDDGVVRTIWDAGGTDTISAVQLGVGAVIDLNQAVYSLHGASSMTAIAFNVTIENAIGSNFDDQINGNSTGNLITGNGGQDTLNGGLGNDTLRGGDGNDRLVGDSGADEMAGGAGDDLYFYQDDSDQIIELANAGYDQIVSSLNIVLSDSLEIEYVQLSGPAISAIGNDTDNKLRGTNADDLLEGRGGDDVLMQSGGHDTLVGGVGDDLYIEPSPATTLVEMEGEGIDTVETTKSFTLPEFVENLLLLSSAVTGIGNSLDNQLSGSGAANRIEGRVGDDYLFGDSGADVLIGGEGDDTLDGYGDPDRLLGGLGNDLYFIGTPDGRTDIIIEYSNEGTDRIISFLDFTLPSNVEELSILNGRSAIGNALDNFIEGNASANLLNGMGGADILKGGRGNDTYIVDNSGDIADEAGGDGLDLVQSSVAYDLGEGIENLTLTGTKGINGSGNSMANTITGNSARNVIVGGAGDDTLNGKIGADSLVGGADDDTYVVDNAKDAIDESTGSGTDTVQSTIAYVLGTGLENLDLLGSGAVAGTGNSVANKLSGNSGANKLDGKDGADTMVGNGGNDTYIVEDAGDRVIETIAGASGGIDLVLSAITFDLSLAGREQVENLTLTGTDDVDAKGNALANTLTGNAGANLLDGQGGADRMAGGLGDDTYVVDLKTDTVTEAAKAGIDTVQSFLSYVLGANLENLELQGLLNIDGTGNALDNTLTGNAGNNKLDGKAGADAMAGGLGNDTYFFDNAGDTADESDGGGIDTIMTPFAMALGADFENLTLTGTAGVSGTGNALANVILGNSGANLLDGQDNSDSLAGGTGNDTLVGGDGNDTLDGGAGIDNLTGGDGNDTYVVDNAKDAVTEAPNGGTDTVKSSIAYALDAEVENLTLTGTGAIAGTGNTLDNVIVGNTGANILMGGAGHDTLDGGVGADKLTGGADSDLFLRHSLAEGKDTITDFQTGAGGDVLDISDLLIGYSGGHEAEFVQCVAAGGNTTVKVDADGALNGAKFTDVCVLTGVTVDFGTLLSDGNLDLSQ